ncbi:uncharacterized protein AB9W97_007006 isoform 1-T1 [Spinachia spinachia]
MAARLLLVILMYSFANSQKQARPKVTISSAVIAERETVTLDCRTLLSPPVHHCYFSVVGAKYSRGFTCVQTVTGTELLRMSDQRAPAEVNVSCYYTRMVGDVNEPSSHSVTSSITIQRWSLTRTKLTSSTTTALLASTPVTHIEQGQTFGPNITFSSPPLTTETQTWKYMFIAICLGGFFFLGLTLLYIKRTLERSSYKRSQADVTGSEKLEEPTPTNENSEMYHLLSTFSEEPPASPQEDMVYS